MKEMNLSEAQNGLVAFNSQLSETTQSLNSFAEQISKTFQDAGSSVDDASNKFAGSLEKWNKAFETLSEASTVVFTSLSALIGTSTTAFANYQSTLQQVQISANIGRDNLENFKRTSEQLAQTTQFSTQQVAAAGLELIKMGLSAREAENALQSVTTVATAQNASLEQTATSMGSVMQAFGLSANEAGKVGDLIQVSGMSVKEFGDAMTSLGPAAVNSGQSINDMAMLLGIFGDSGIKSADGAKGLVSALEGLHDPKVATALRARKIETADMVEILKKLRTSIGDLPSLEQSKILKEIFGGSASTSLQTFVSMSDQELDKAIKKYGDFQGAAGKAAEEVKKGLLYAITDLKNSIQSLFSEIGASLAPTMTVMIKSITSVINAFNSMPDSIKSVISHVGLLATGVAGAFIGAKGITGFVTKGIEGFSELSTLLSSKVSPASKNATNELITLKKAQKSILENSLANTISVNPAVPKELLLSDTTAAKALSAIIPTNSTTNKANTATRQVSSPLTNSFAGAIPAYLTNNKAPTVTGQASAALTNALAVASPANSTTNKAIAAAIPTSATANKAIVATGQASATAAVGVNTFRTSLSSVPGMLGNLALAASTAFKTIGKSVVSATLPILPFVALAGALYLAWEMNLGGLRDILDMAWATVQDIFGNITGFIEGQISQNQVYWLTAWESIKDVLFGTLAILDNVLRFFFGTIDKYFKFYSSLMVGDFGGAWQAIVSIFDSATGGLSKNISIWIQQLGKAFQTGLGGLVEMGHGLWDALTGSPEQKSGAWDRIKKGFNNMLKGLKDSAVASGDLYRVIVDNIKNTITGFSGTSLRLQGEGLFKASDLSKFFENSGGSEKANKTNTPDSNHKGLNLLNGDGSKNQDDRIERLIKDSRSQMGDSISRAMEKFYSKQHKDEDHNETYELPVQARNIYESFLGRQPINWIRGVGGRHAGVDLQAKGDYEKKYGSMVYAPEKMKVTAINANLPYGAMVKFQSLVDERITYILHHLSPGDVRKNIKLGQVFDAGQSLGARVGGKAEIAYGAHWKGVHLHVEKYINGVLDSIDRDKMHTTVLKQKAGLVQEVSEEVYKEQVSLKELEGHMLRIVQAQHLVNRSTVQGQKDWQKLEDEKKKILSENAAQRASLEKALAKKREDQVKNEKDAEAELDVMRKADFQQRLENIPVLQKMEMAADEARKELLKKQESQLKNFKGNGTQLDELEKLQLGERVRLEDQLNKQTEEGKQSLYQELEQTRSEYLDDEVRKSQKAVDDRLAAELKALEKQQKQYDYTKIEYWELEQFKTDATERAVRERREIELKYLRDVAAARKNLIASEIEEPEREFLDKAQGLIQQKLNQKNLGETTTEFMMRPENIESMAQSIQGGSIKSALEAARKELSLTRQEGGSLEESLELEKNNPFGFDQVKIDGIQANINQLKQKSLILMSVIDAFITGDSTLIDRIENFGKFIPQLEKINQEGEIFRLGIDTAGKGLVSVASAFGEVGNQIGGIIINIAGAASTGSALLGKMDVLLKKGGKNANGEDKGFSLGEMELGDLASMAGIALQAGEFLWSTIGWSFSETSKANNFLKKKLEDEESYALEKTLATEREKLDIRKKSGQNVLEEELILIDQESKARLKAVDQQVSEARRAQGSGFLGIWNMDDYSKLYETEKNAQKTRDEEERNRQNLQRQAQEQQHQKEAESLKNHYDRLAETKLISSRLANDRVAEAEEESVQEKTKIFDDYIQNLTGLISSGSDAEQLNALAENLNAQLEQSDHKLAQRKREIRAQELADEKDAEYDHQEALLASWEDGAHKEFELQKIGHRRTIDGLKAELEKYEVHSKDWERVTKQIADAELTADAEIKKSKEELRKARKQQLEDLNLEMDVLKAKLTENTVDDVQAETAASLSQMVRDEIEELRKARADHNPEIESEEQLQSILNGIQQKWALKRQVSEKAAIQNMGEARKKEQQDAYQTSLDVIQKLIDAEQQQIDKINKQNDALRQQIKVKEELLKQDEKEFDKADTGLFRQAVAGVNYDEQIRQALDDFHNPEGVKTESYSAKSLQEAAFARIELLKLRNENKLALEQYSENDSEENLRQFLLEKERIAALQARVAEEIQRRGGFTYQNEEGQTVYDKLSPKEYADLEKQKSDAYKSFQEARKEALRSATEASVSKINEDITANERLNQAHQDAINGHKTRQQELQNALLASHAAIDLQIEAVMASQNDWAAGVEKLAGNMKGPLSQIVGLYKDIESAVKNAASAVNTPLTPSSSNTNGKPKQPEQGRESYRIAHFQLDGGDGWFYTSDQNKQEWQAMDRWQAGQKSASSSSSSGDGGGNTAKPFQTGFVDGVYNDYDANGNQRSTNPAYMTPEQKIAAYGSSYYTQGKFATGGVVPAGFPNDTYPALLTSGEAVLPTWFTNLLASAYKTMPGLSGLVDNSRKIQITLQGVFNEPGMVKREIMQALQQANYSAAGVNGTYYMNTGLN